MRDIKSSLIDPGTLPRLPMGVAAQYWAAYMGQHYFSRRLFQSMRDTAEKALLSGNLPGEESHTTPVPELRAEEMSPELFQQVILKNGSPVVLKGLANDWPALKKWSPTYFGESYGEQMVPVRKKGSSLAPESLLYTEVPLSELIADILAEGEFYGANLEDIFNNNPELRKDLDLASLENFSLAPGITRDSWRSLKNGKIISTQFFISSEKARTGFHCATAENLFVQVYGQKKWTFVNPRHSPWMYPIVRKDILYAASEIDQRKSASQLSEEGFPLYRFIPKYETTLEPGDVLLSPPWWWHAVDNLTPAIGVASRFVNKWIKGNRVFSVMSLLSPAIWKYSYTVLRTGWSADKTSAKTIFEDEVRKLPSSSIDR